MLVEINLNALSRAVARAVADEARRLLDVSRQRRLTTGGMRSSVAAIQAIQAVAEGQGAMTQDTVETLVDLARQDREADFRAIAQANGVHGPELEALWAGTVSRLRGNR